MNVWLNRIDGLSDALTAMHMSKRSWTREMEEKIRSDCYYGLGPTGALSQEAIGVTARLADQINILAKWGWKHPTLLSFIDLSITVEGLHRAGQDDLDSHAKRFDNRIIRSSTRLAKFEDGEMSDYYKGKIVPTDAALAALGIEAPDRIVLDGNCYVKTVNGYIREDLQNNKDVRRGLYMLSIPSNFIFKINLAQWSHVYRERCEKGTANPEVKQVAEIIQTQLEQMLPWFDREYMWKVKT